MGSGWWGAPHSCAGRGAWSARATQSSETADRSKASQCGRADAHRGGGGRRRTSSAASVFMPSVRSGQLAGFTFALQNGLFLWFGQWNLRGRVGSGRVQGGQGGWARRVGKAGAGWVAYLSTMMCILCTSQPAKVAPSL